MLLLAHFQKLFLLVFSFFIFLIFPQATQAQQEFTVSYDTVYLIKHDGAADVTQHITLSNNFSTIYATSYSLILEGKIPQNIHAFEGNNPLAVDLIEEQEKAQIKVEFPNAVVGKSKERTFSINYTVPEVAVQNGQVWDFAIPKLASPETINAYKLTLKIPTSFGNPAYISPEPREKIVNGDYQDFTYDKEDLIKAGVVAAFGQSQIFSFNLVYHIQNPNPQTGETEVALPPDTAFQRVYYESLDPKPKNIWLDHDGNWLAVYRLGGKEKLDISLKGAVQVFAKPQQHYPQVDPKEVSHYLMENQYWEVADPEIKRVARTLKTPRAIYDYVSSYLNYDYSRVRENVPRLGAKGALQNPNNAICMEFTDLFITLARSIGIPAREVNGYAYTENPSIQPLSLVTDLLHAWPEYWDENLGVWRPVDPTWGDTTGGIDFFDKFDLSHITFAIHGADSTLPLSAGSYKRPDSNQKDVTVEFAQIPKIRESDPQIHVNFMNSISPFKPSTLDVVVTNPGPTAFYDMPIALSSKNAAIKSDKQENVNFLAPFDSYSFSVPVQTMFFPLNKDAKITIQAGETSLVYNIPVTQVRLTNILLFFVALLLVSIIVVLGLKKKLLPQKLITKWHKLFGNKQ